MACTTTEEKLIIPNENDILLGRGGKNNRHNGNEQLRELARQHTMQYCLSTKKEKTLLISKLVMTVHKMGPPGRFLKHDKASESWVVVPISVAKEKASQALRDAIAECEDRMKHRESKGKSDNTSEQHSKDNSLDSPSDSRKIWHDINEFEDRLKSPPLPRAVLSQAPSVFSGTSSIMPPTINQRMNLIGDSPISYLKEKSSSISFNPLEIQLEEQSDTSIMADLYSSVRSIDDDHVLFGREILLSEASIWGQRASISAGTFMNKNYFFNDDD